MLARVEAEKNIKIAAVRINNTTKVKPSLFLINPRGSEVSAD